MYWNSALPYLYLSFAESKYPKVSVAPLGKCQVFSLSPHLAGVLYSHSLALSINAPGRLKSVYVFLNMIDAYPGSSTNCSAPISIASLLPPPAAPPYITSRTSVNSRNSLCLSVGVWGIHLLSSTVALYSAALFSNKSLSELFFIFSSSVEY